jgi:DNA-binding CsgD family transcriptional regulator
VNDPLLGVIADLFPLRDSAALMTVILETLLTTIPADWISVNEVGSDLGAIRSVVVPPLSDEWMAIYARTVTTNPLVTWYRETLNGRSVRFSDVATTAELHATTIWQEFYGPLEIEYQMACILSSGTERMMAIALCRRRDSRDFSDAERDLLDRARPYIIQAYRNALDHDQLLTRIHARPGQPVRDLSLFGLTPRELEVLTLVASGRANAHAAQELGISAATIKTHLERIYRKLGVKGRSDAARMLWAAPPLAAHAADSGTPVRTS